MMTPKVLRPIKKHQASKGTRILSFVWSMKKKADGTSQGRMTVHGHSQKDKECCVSSSTHALVTYDAKIYIIPM